MGVVVMGFGIFALSDGKDLAKLVDWGSQVTGSDLSIALYSTASVVLIIASLLAIAVASIGCCGAIKVRSSGGWPPALFWMDRTTGKRKTVVVRGKKP